MPNFHSPQPSIPSWALPKSPFSLQLRNTLCFFLSSDKDTYSKQNWLSKQSTVLEYIYNIQSEIWILYSANLFWSESYIFPLQEALWTVRERLFLSCSTELCLAVIISHSCGLNSFVCQLQFSPSLDKYSDRIPIQDGYTVYPAFRKAAWLCQSGQIQSSWSRSSQSYNSKVFQTKN